MSVTERLMKLGSFTIQLTDVSLKDDIEYFEHLVVIPGEIRNPGLLDDASILSIARYAGIIRGKRVSGKPDAGQDTLTLSGQGVDGWLGDENQIGFVFEAERDYIAKTFLETLDEAGGAPFGLLRDDAGGLTSIRAGTINAIGGTYTGEHGFTDQRTAIRYLVDVFGLEYRVNPDFTIDTGTAAELFQTTPTAIAARKITDGRDPNLDGIPLDTFEADNDVKDWTSRVVLLAEGSGPTLKTGAADAAANPYLDGYGDPVVRVRMVSESGTSAANADSRAAVHLAETDTLRKALTISTTEFDVEGDFNVGDSIYVWDPTDEALVDTTNEVRFRGQTLHPVSLRVLGYSWPIREGMSVYIRHGDGTYTDVTDSIIFESSGSSKLEVGATPRSTLVTDPAGISGRVNPGTGGDDSSVPDVPAHTGTPWSSVSYVDDQGITKSRIQAQWSEPLNTDASTILDGDRYDVRWRINGESDYQYSSVDFSITTFLIQDLAPGVTYEVSVQAVDINGNVSGYGSDESVSASTDVTPPSVPNAPVLAGNPLSVQVTHDLGTGGGTFNLEPDLDHLNVYISTSSGFTPGPSNHVGKIPANAGHLSLAISVVQTFEILDTVGRFVKVTAVDRSGNESAASAQGSVAAVLINTVHITDAAISTAKIGDLQVSRAKIALLAVDTAQIEALSVTTAKIDFLAVDTAQIALLAVDTAQIANLAVDTAQIEALAVTTAKIDDLAVERAKIDLLAVDTAQIASAAITNAKISDLSADKIDTGTLSASRIATDSLSVNKISGGHYDNSDIIFDSGSDLESDNFLAGSAGWRIRGDGSAEFSDVVVRGEIVATSGTLSNLTVLGTITLGNNGLFRTSASGARIELSDDFVDRLKFFSGAGSEVANAQIIAGTNPSLDMTGPTSTGGGGPANISLIAQGSSAGRVLLVGQIIATPGSAADPQYSFNGDDDTGMYRINANRIGFATAGVFEWEITSAGNFVNVLAGSSSASNTTPRTHLGVPGGLNIFTKSSGQTIIAGRSGSDGGIIDFRNDGTQVGTISVSGSNTAYNTSSDERLKDNIRPFDGGLALIRSLPVRQWEWNTVPGGSADVHGIGFVAQEIDDLIPAITNEPDILPDEEGGAGWWSVDYGRLTPWLAGAIQELADRLEVLEGSP